MKKHISTIIAVLAVFFSLVFGAWAQGGFQAPQPFRKSGSNWLMNSATEHLGSSGSRIAKIWTTDLDATNLVVGGAAAGNLDMGGFNISNGGTFTAAILRATSTTAASYITYRLGVGTTTPVTELQATAAASNATSTMTVGKTGQNKGTCLEFFDTAGTAVYFYIAAGATAFTGSATSCK